MLFKERSISEALVGDQAREDNGHVSKLCVKTLFISENFHSYNFVAFFVSLAVVISCIRKMSFSVTSAKREFTPATVTLSTSQEVYNEQLVFASEVNSTLHAL